jgi:NitT/TauT family transport system substrate-binding protein
MLAALAFVLAACGGVPESTSADADRVTAVVLPFLAMMPFHIAAEEGYFAEQNLDVEFLLLTRNQDFTAALALGQVDVTAGLLTINEIALAATGARNRMVAALGESPTEGCAFGAMIARRDHAESGALDDPEQLRQMAMDTDVTLPFAYLLDKLLRDHELTIDDVKLVNIPPPAALEALRVGAIDLTMDSEPFITMHLEGGEAAVWKRYGDIEPGFPGSVLMYGPNLLDERPDVGRRFAVAMLKAIRQFRLGKTPRNLDIVERASGLTRRQVETACWPVLSKHGIIDPNAYRGYQEWAVERGLVDRVVTDEELFDDSFIRHANEVLAR